MISACVKDIFRDVEVYISKEVEVSGWVRTVRDNKNFGFIELNDGSFFKSIQIVFENSLSNFEEIAKLGVGSSITVQGTVVESPGAKQPFEIKAISIVIEGESPADYPLQKKRHSMEFLRTIAHLRPRTNTFAAVFRVRSLASYAIHSFFNEKGFVHVHTPIITASDCEGAGEMFEVATKSDFFSKQTYLTVSGQLYAETFAMALRNVYTFGPTFRAENSNTVRHAAEFWMMEPEMAFADLNDNMDIAEEMLKFIIKYVMENAPEEMEFFNQFVDKTLFDRLNNILNSEFGRVTYTEAIEILEKADAKFEYPVKWGSDLQTEHERYLTEQVYKKPVFVTDYPKDIKAFYMRLNDDGKTVAAMDLLMPGVGELIGGSQREERTEVLLTRMKEMDLNENDYWWYMDTRKYGGVKHSGYGMGFERCIMYITGISNIRDVLPYPRTVNNADF